MKYEILRILKEKSMEYVSGERLSEILGVSRTAVWKCINELKKEGYVIESVSKKGYKLETSPDILNEFEIGHGLNTSIIGRQIHYFKSIDSTNNYAKKAAQEGCEEGTVIVADAQTSGRGRLGRSWESKEDSGIWMSVVLRPYIAPEDVQIMTLAASVAVVAALKSVAGVDAGIKWPNDIIIGGRKVCGILTEMSTEMDRVNYLVLGIGININQKKEDFPEELRNTAISLKAYMAENNMSVANIKRSDIIKIVLLELEKQYENMKRRNTEEIINKWRENSVTIGRKVKIIYKNVEYEGTAKDVTDDGKLIVHCSDGVTREISSGEVSVRGIMGN
ncbi:MAG TPA: biotin--[acetyl-CoA-carboxylase] ligase [Clostridiaceae bacterium]|nr:biotin--[acetyl-CoA-carboxylase] ligase [Clostridiaceae bacterium]